MIEEKEFWSDFTKTGRLVYGISRTSERWFLSAGYPLCFMTAILYKINKVFSVLSEQGQSNKDLINGN